MNSVAFVRSPPPDSYLAFSIIARLRLRPRRILVRGILIEMFSVTLYKPIYNSGIKSDITLLLAICTYPKWWSIPKCLSGRIPLVCLRWSWWWRRRRFDDGRKDLWGKFLPRFREASIDCVDLEWMRNLDNVADFVPKCQDLETLFNLGYT